MLFGLGEFKILSARPWFAFFRALKDISSARRITHSISCLSSSVGSSSATGMGVSAVEEAGPATVSDKLT